MQGAAQLWMWYSRHALYFPLSTPSRFMAMWQGRGWQMFFITSSRAYIVGTWLYGPKYSEPLRMRRRVFKTRG